ncbi:MAG TPA: magnesium transporter [Candidatus Saccharimonadales bacterium]|nr:magnesium transporter [Candidatus Saccharimonadales bacterium]
MKKTLGPIYADDATENVSLLLRLRLPWLIAGLLLGGITTLVVSRFETTLEADVRLAFFIPIIVYMSGAVGAQTESIYVHNLNKHQATLRVYLIKELALGLMLGAIFGAILALFAFVVFGAQAVATTVGLAMFTGVATASIVGLIVPTILKREHQDPSVGAAPVVTAIQDLISLLIYFVIASTIIL